MQRAHSNGFLALLFIVLVLVPAFLIRLHPVTSESFSNDAIMSQQAAARGFAANAMDSGETLSARRGHPPLLSYIISMNNRLFGSDAFRARLFSIIAGSICCLVVSLSVTTITSGLRSSLFGGLLGGWMIGLLPVHLYVSRSSNWDAVYSLLALCSLLFVSLYTTRRELRYLLAAGLFASLAFLTCEIGLLLFPVFVFALVRDFRVRPVPVVLREWLRLVLLVIAVVMVLWPAAVLKLHLYTTIRFRLLDSATTARNLPWYMFYVHLFRQSPGFAILSLLGISSFLFLPSMKRNMPGRGDGGTGTVFDMLIPFAIYVGAAFVVSLRNTLVHVHHIADMLPPLAVFLSCACVVAAEPLMRAGRAVLRVICLVALALSLPAVLDDDPHTVGPQEHPGFLGVRDYLGNHPGARSYYFYHSLMPYYLAGEHLEGEPPRYWTPEKVARVKATPYDFVVSDWSMVSGNYPDIDALSRGLAPEYDLIHTVMHRRTGEPVAWIFERADSLRAQ